MARSAYQVPLTGPIGHFRDRAAMQRPLHGRPLQTVATGGDNEPDRAQKPDKPDGSISRRIRTARGRTPPGAGKIQPEHGMILTS